MSSDAPLDADAIAANWFGPDNFVTAKTAEAHHADHVAAGRILVALTDVAEAPVTRDTMNAAAARLRAVARRYGYLGTIVWTKGPAEPDDADTTDASTQPAAAPYLVTAAAYLTDEIYEQEIGALR